MVGDKAEQMRSRAKAFGEMAQRAVENGGSSFSNLNSLIEELSLRSHLLEELLQDARNHMSRTFVEVCSCYFFIVVKYQPS